MDETMAGLSLEAFVAWLQGKAEDAVVGVTGDDARCPLAMWLREVMGDQWEVTARYYANVVTQRWGNVPAWAREFAHRCEVAYGPGAEVKAWQAAVRLTMVCAGW